MCFACGLVLRASESIKDRICSMFATLLMRFRPPVGHWVLGVGGGGGGARHGHPGAPTDRGRINTDTRRCEILVRGGRWVGQEGVRDRGTQERQQTRGGATQNAGATPRGTRAGTPDKEEGHSKAGEATRTAGTGNQNGANGGACAWEAATITGMAWPASPVATGCQGNPCSTGIRWGVSPAAQMGCLRNRSGSSSGAHQP